MPCEACGKPAPYAGTQDRIRVYTCLACHHLTMVRP